MSSQFIQIPNTKLNQIEYFNLDQIGYIYSDNKRSVIVTQSRCHCYRLEIEISTLINIIENQCKQKSPFIKLPTSDDIPNNENYLDEYFNIDHIIYISSFGENQSFISMSTGRICYINMKTNDLLNMIDTKKILKESQ